MVVKKVYSVKDEILHDEYELFGKNGVMQKDNLMLLDFAQMGQYIIENCSINGQDYKEEDIDAMCRQWAREISNIIINEAYENTISDIYDDEELELI